MAVRTLLDALGRAVHIPRQPQRLVSLVPSITETLCCFGWQAQLVARTDYCTEPAEHVRSLASIGGTKNPDVERLVALRPDLVFAVQEENRRQDVERLEAAGVPVYVFEPRTVRHGIDLLWRLAELLDCRTDVAPLIEEIEQEYAETMALGAARRRVRVFCPIWKDPYMTINVDTYVHDTLWVAGGDNIFAERQRRFPLAADVGLRPEDAGARYAARDRRYPRVTLHEMAARNPEVIILPDEPYVFSQADVVDFAPFAEVPAVRHGRIHVIDGKMVNWYGPRIGTSLRTLRQLLAL